MFGWTLSGKFPLYLRSLSKVYIEFVAGFAKMCVRERK